MVVGLKGRRILRLKKVSLKKYEKALGRKIQVFRFSSRDEVKPTELLNNILNGKIISGSW